VDDNGVLTADQVGEDDQRARIAGLVNDAKQGRREAVGELVSELSPLLWQVARASGLSSADAEDVLQSVWLNLLANLDAIRTPGSLTSWLVTATRRQAWRVRAADRRQKPVDHEWLTAIPDAGADSEQHLIMKDEQRELWEALSSLPGRCQKLLRIVAFVPRPDYDDIAVRLGIPRGSVGPTRGRCLDKLRSALDGALDGEGGQR
jgi:RNA polymerase sigma factor (sigma-70 family)